jgi:invasion protein IalB
MTDARAGAPWRHLAAATFAATVLSLSTSAGAQQSTPKEPQQSTPQQGDQAKPEFSWSRWCVKQGEVTLCEISYGVLADYGNDKKRWVARAGIREREGTDERRLFMFAPLGMRLSAGVIFRIDENPPKKAAFTVCIDPVVGCQAEIKADDELLDALKAGSELQIQAVRFGDNQTANLTVSLVGFTNAYDGPPQRTIEAQSPAAAQGGGGGKGDAPAQ